MLFNSYVFVLFFLPVTIIGYFVLNRFRLYRVSMLFLLGMSLWFYGYFNYQYLLIMLCSIAANFLFYKAMGHCKTKKWLKTGIAAVAILLNIAALFYFKYYDFFIENINAVFKTGFTLKHVLLPLGISFFTFQQLSFVIDAYKGELPEYDFVNYACFVTFFPQLVAGPIVTHDELVPQFADLSKKSFNWDNFAPGMYAFALGLAKKVLVADVLGNVANWGYGNIEGLNSVTALLVTLAYTVQIYFDFSGYSDMAIGMGKMLNIDLPINFNSPYKALTINDFWSRWHITLTRFFTRYIYIPLGGNRKGVMRTYLNIMIVYLVSGIWHGANWTFILWGVCHGVFCVISRHFKNRIEKWHPALSWCITFCFVNLMWIFFRAESIHDAFTIIHKIVGVNIGGIPQEMINTVMTAEWDFLAAKFAVIGEHQVLILLGYILLPLIAALGMKNVPERLRDVKPRIRTALLTAVLITMCVMSFSGVSTFLYFNF